MKFVYNFRLLAKVKILSLILFFQSLTLKFQSLFKNNSKIRIFSNAKNSLFLLQSKTIVEIL